MICKSKSPVFCLCELIEKWKIIVIVNQMEDFSLGPDGFEFLQRIPCIFILRRGIKVVSSVGLGTKHISGF